MPPLQMSHNTPRNRSESLFQVLVYIIYLSGLMMSRGMREGVWGRELGIGMMGFSGGLEVWMGRDVGW
jgi:hypothetical protein